MSQPPPTLADWAATRESMLSQQETLRKMIEAQRQRGVPAAPAAAAPPQSAVAAVAPVVAAAPKPVEATVAPKATVVVTRPNEAIAPKEERDLAHRLLKDRGRKVVVHGNQDRPRSSLRLRAALLAGIFALAVPFAATQVAETAVAVGGVAVGATIQHVASQPEVVEADAKAPEAKTPQFSYMGPIKRANLDEVQALLWEAIKQTETGRRHFDDNGDPMTSRVGAVGISQMMPETAVEAAALAGMPFDNERYRQDPTYNEALGVAHFKQLYRAFGGDPVLVTAAYNMGSGATSHWAKGESFQSRSGTPWRPAHPKDMSELPEETNQYIQRNLRHAQQLAPDRGVRDKITALFQNSMHRPSGQAAVAQDAPTGHDQTQIVATTTTKASPGYSGKPGGGEPSVQMRDANGQTQWVPLSQYREMREKGMDISAAQANTVPSGEQHAAQAAAPRSGGLRGVFEGLKAPAERIQQERKRMLELRDRLKVGDASVEPMQAQENPQFKR